MRGTRCFDSVVAVATVESGVVNVMKGALQEVEVAAAEVRCYKCSCDSLGVQRILVLYLLPLW